MVKFPFYKCTRGLLWCAMAAWMSFGVWRGWQGTTELVELMSEGKFVNAQVIGQDPMPAGARMGYVHYAFNEGSRAIANKLPVPVAKYSDFWIGRPIPVTYLPDDPHVVRIGEVTRSQVFWSVIVALIFLVAGALAIGLALVGMQALFRPQSAAPGPTPT